MCGPLSNVAGQMMDRQNGTGWRLGGSQPAAAAPAAMPAPAAAAAPTGAGTAVSSLFGGAPSTSPVASPGVKSTSPISGKSVLQVG